MKAAYLDAPGPPDVIRYGDLPTPDPKPGQVRVRVAASSVNPIDVYYRNGMVKADLPLPFVPGADFAGTVDAIGPGVTNFKPGDRVWGSNQGLLGRQGVLAEFACVDVDFAYPLPAGVPFETAAATALVGITAHLGLFRCAKLQPGEWVFVNGGTGGVGSMVVQMAKAVGAKVIASVGSDDKAALALRLGADNIVNYKSENFVEQIKRMTDGKGVQVWYETQPPTDLDRTIELTAAWGRIVLMAGRAARPAFPNGPFYVKGLSAHGFAMFAVPPAEQAECATDIGRWLSEGRLRPVIGAEFPLKQAAEAHRLQEENTIGKAGTLSGKIVVRI